ncbi:MAG TPA: hypothetical protein VKZ97_10445 [Flavobacteriaceae bacterium]|nr:hypothetical protein [Flavobacteriaceae bacterium]
MADQVLHITNGSSLTSYLKELEFTGEFLTWHEMLCEGPTVAGIDSDKFLEVRKAFFKETYDLEIDEAELKKEFSKLDGASEKYKEIILWFEYDLFCHINLLAVISLLHQREIKLPVFLVSSGRVKNLSGLKGLAELSPNQLVSHYEKRFKLSKEDKDLAVSLWRTYNGKDHNLFVPQLTKKSSFLYLSNCLKAHLERFPDSKTGLSIIEKNLLEIVRDNTIKSKYHLLGYALNYQGYYGYGDLQLERIINKLDMFFTEENERLKLNRKGHEALLGIHNFAFEIHDNIQYGGINALDYQYNRSLKKLVKTDLNAH